MAILKIIKENDPTLRKISRRVETINPHILTLIGDMRDTLHKANGAGLAAVQVGVLRRIVLVETADGILYEMINPEIIRTEGRQQKLEGCLSIPDVWGITDRPEKVTVRYTDKTGKQREVTGSGLTARAFCHELDHLEGKLFTDKALRILTDEELAEYTADERNND